MTQRERTKSKTIILTGAVFLVLVAGLVWLGKPAAPGSSARLAGEGPLVAEESRFDFGTISMAVGAVNHRFGIRNPGETLVTVEQLYTSCMCTKATLTTPRGSSGPFGMPGHGLIPNINAAIAPGETAEVDVVFDPAAHGPAGIGQIERVVSLETGSSAPLELRFTAFVTP